MFEIIIEILTNLISAVIAVDFATRYFDVKHEGKNKFIGFVTVCFIYFLVVTYINSRTDFEGIAGIVYILVIFVYALMFLKGNWMEKAVISILWNIILLVASFGTLSIIRLVFNKEFSELIMINDSVRIYVLIAATMAKFILTRIVLIIRKRNSLFLFTKESVAMVTIFFLLFIMVLAFLSIEVGTENERMRHYMVTGLLMGFVGIIVFVYYFFYKLSRKNIKKLEDEFAYEYALHQTEYFDQIKKIYEETRILRHDMKSYVDTIYLYLKSNDYDGMRCYIEKLDEHVKNYGNIVEMTKNKGVNAALTKIKYDCDKNNILFYYFISADVEKINEMELGILLTNALNNAVEACLKKQDNREIKLTIENHNNYLHISIRNSIKDSELNKNPKLLTSKEDHNIHGFGLKSIEHIVYKYDGQFKIKEDNGMFIQEMFLKYKTI